jgi:hypothetical protein
MHRLDDAALLEIAHLYCAWCMTRGATHTLNNALTALTGLFDASGDGVDLERELERCTRVARGLTAHHALRFGRGEEVELTAVVRRTAEGLRETLGRRFELEVEVTPELLYVEVDPARIELLVFVLGYRLADLTERGGRMRLTAAEGEKPQSASLELELLADDLPEDAADAALDPAAAPSAGAALALHALASIAASCDGSLAARPLPGGVRLRALFPQVE